MNVVFNKSLTNVISSTPWRKRLYNNAKEFWKDSEELHHWYIVWRTLAGQYKDFKPDAVLYVGKSPTAYLKRVNDFEIPEELASLWHKFLWNQAVVPMLIIQSTTKIRIYTAYMPPQKNDQESRLESILEYAADALSLDQLWTAIEAGTIYKEKPELFNRSKSVDRHLLENLNAAAIKIAETQIGGLSKKENVEFAHKFLTRLLFVSYLIERGMIKGKHFSSGHLKNLRPDNKKENGYFLRHLFADLKTFSKKKDALCRLFYRVKQRFNGSLFPDSIATEKDKYTETFIDIVDKFLHGHSLKNGQYVLEFWAYDFGVIPIETISAVYESFLGKQGEVDQSQGRIDPKRMTGAYYTPLHLAELTVDVALERNKKPIQDLTVLDPACGSGVFLVCFFGRMAESLRRKEGYTGQKKNINWARKLAPLLSQLYGIDISPTACHITCFSLYLALLDQLRPMDVEYLRKYNKNKKALPPLLASSSSDSLKTVYENNLFNGKLSLKKKLFDIVIGNPPWVSGSNQKDDFFLDWRKQNPNILGPNKQIAHGFMWKSLDYLCDSGTACLLLSASVLFNGGTNEFQRKWLKSVTVDRVVNYSDLRFVLFEHAIHPCVAICFRPATSETANLIKYESPKTDIRSQQGGPVYIREEDISLLKVSDIINAAAEGRAPAIWKSHCWGTLRDNRLINKLNNLPKLGALIEDRELWDKSTGIMVGNHSKKGWWDSDWLYLRSRQEFSLVVSPNDCKTVSEAGFPLKAEAPRKRNLFIGPKVLVTEGALDMKVAFCDFPVIFKKSIYLITSPDAEMLKFLSVVIRSDLMQFYLFHTSGSWGIEREKVRFEELLSLPFIFPENSTNPKMAKQIVAEISRNVSQFANNLKNEQWLGAEQKRKTEIDKIRKELEPMVLAYYGIDKYETMLIEDTIDLATKSFHPKQTTDNIPTIANVSTEYAQTYTRTLCGMLNHFGTGSNFKINGKIVKGQPYSVVCISLAKYVQLDIPVVNANHQLALLFQKMELLLKSKGEDLFFVKI
ncbi:MAG: hypothetical protein A2Y12_19665 [Planctomycetes bacterium GWF2_42_9]|nr:MAG: hypothetical protein A2Y12_19665 [Planctomycetes bacterium GWF2_42_9]